MRWARARQVGDDGGVLSCHELLEGFDTVGSGLTLLVDVFLDGNGHAVERTKRHATGNHGVGAPGCLQGAGRELDGNGVHLLVDSL